MPPKAPPWFSWIVGLTLLACGAPAVEDPVLATYPGGEITASEYSGLAGRQGAIDPEKGLATAALGEWLAAQATAAGLDSRRDLALQIRRLEARPLVQALENRIRAENEPTEEAIREYLEAHRSQLDKPRKVRLSNLFKRAPEGGDPAAREAARRALEDIRARLVAGEDFAELAKQESQGVNRYRGGRMGAVPPGQLRKDVEEAAFALAVGEISPVIAVPEGFVILKNDGFVEATRMSEEEAIERIREAMRRWNFEDAWEALRAELLGAGADLLDPGAIEAATPETVIGTVAGEPLTYADIDALARSDSKARAPQSERLTSFRMHAVLEELAFRRLAASRAQEMGVEPAPQASARTAGARAWALADAELERRAREQPIEVADSEARSFFAAHPKLFSLPSRFQVSVIQLRLDDPDTQQLKRKTELGHRLVEEIRSGARTFSQAAREFSDHPSAADGGDVGMKPRRWAAALGPNVLAAFDGLEPGQITDLVRQDHLWILLRGDSEEGRPLSWDEARDAARWGVEQQKLQARKAALQEALLEELRPDLVILQLPEVLADPRGRARPQRPRTDGPLEGAEEDRTQ
jgi:parvulin-like peptidyl-prolyl isomerase